MATGTSISMLFHRRSSLLKLLSNYGRQEEAVATSAFSRATFASEWTMRKSHGEMAILEFKLNRPVGVRTMWLTGLVSSQYAPFIIT